MNKEIRTVGFLHIGYGVWEALGAVIVLVFTVGVGFLVREVADAREPLPILTAVGLPIALLLGGMATLEIVGGWGVLRLQGWARYLVMVLSGLDLFSLPIGTAVGVYSLMTLTKDEVQVVFGGKCC